MQALGDNGERSAQELSVVLKDAVRLNPCLKASNPPKTLKKETINLTFHLVLRQANRGPVGEDIGNSAKPLVHEPGGHSTHWHLCEGKPTTGCRSSYSLALRSCLWTDLFSCCP